MRDERVAELIRTRKPPLDVWVTFNVIKVDNGHRFTMYGNSLVEIDNLKEAMTEIFGGARVRDKGDKIEILVPREMAKGKGNETNAATAVGRTPLSMDVERAVNTSETISEQERMQYAQIDRNLAEYFAERRAAGL